MSATLEFEDTHSMSYGNGYAQTVSLKAGEFKYSLARLFFMGLA